MPSLILDYAAFHLGRLHVASSSTGPRGNIVKGAMAACLVLMPATVALDTMVPVTRFTVGPADLTSGVELMPVITLLLGFMLGPDLEEFLRRALTQSKGDPMTFLTNPDSLFFIVLTLVFIYFLVIRKPLTRTQGQRK